MTKDLWWSRSSVLVGKYVSRLGWHQTILIPLPCVHSFQICDFFLIPIIHFILKLSISPYLFGSSTQKILSFVFSHFSVMFSAAKVTKMTLLCIYSLFVRTVGAICRQKLRRNLYQPQKRAIFSRMHQNSSTYIIWTIGTKLLKLPSPLCLVAPASLRRLVGRCRRHCKTPIVSMRGNHGNFHGSHETFILVSRTVSNSWNTSHRVWKFRIQNTGMQSRRSSSNELEEGNSWNTVTRVKGFTNCCDHSTLTTPGSLGCSPVALMVIGTIHQLIDNIWIGFSIASNWNHCMTGIQCQRKPFEATTARHYLADTIKVESRISSQQIIQSIHGRKIGLQRQNPNARSPHEKSRFTDTLDTTTLLQLCECSPKICVITS